MNERVGWFFAASRSLEVRFDDEVPPEIHASIQPIIERTLWLLPTWLQMIFVRYTTPTEDAASMSITVNEEYRSGTLHIHPNWLMGSEQERISNVRHEFIHFPIDVLATACKQAIDLHPNEDVKKIARENLRIAVEKAVVDLEQAIARQHGESGDVIVKRKP